MAPNYKGCVRTSRWKFIRDEIGQADELYDLQTDAGEKKNLVYDKPELSEELKRDLGKHVSKMRKTTSDRGKEKDKVDRVIKDTLRALGYID